jgi:Fe-coproporphyrin III synthase
MLSESGSSRSGFIPARIVHLHPTRFCNLTCQHCYSESGPTLRGEIQAAAIISALSSLRMEGYEVLSLSGGEPLLYSGIEVLLKGAAALGYRINLITNGAPVGGRLLNLVAEYVNLIAVSLDGAPKTHIELRGHPNAFIHAERAMDRLASKDVRFGIAYCVSRESLSDMPWAVEFAKVKGAGLVQFHPFAPIGRGRWLSDRLSLSETDKARAYVIAALLDTGKEPVIQIDLAPIGVVCERRADYSVLQLEDASKVLLSDLVNPLIVEETGLVSPLSYGIDHQFAIGMLGIDFTKLIANYKEVRWRELRTLLEKAFTRLGMNGENFVDWFYHVVNTSYCFQEHNNA